MRMAQRKLDAVKRLLKVSTETEAVDAALHEIAFRRGLLGGMRALRRAGGLADLFDERWTAAAHPPLVHDALLAASCR